MSDFQSIRFWGLNVSLNWIRTAQQQQQQKQNLI